MELGLGWASVIHARPDARQSRRLGSAADSDMNRVEAGHRDPITATFLKQHRGEDRAEPASVRGQRTHTRAEEDPSASRV